MNEARVTAVLQVIAFAVYCLIAFGIIFAAEAITEDGAWLELVYEVAWVPAAVPAVILYIWLTTYVRGR